MLNLLHFYDFISNLFQNRLGDTVALQYSLVQKTIEKSKKHPQWSFFIVVPKKNQILA